MYELVKSPQAKDDLKKLWHNGFEMWGDNQASVYLMQLDASMKRLCNFPHIGKSRDNIRAGYRSIRVNKHLIYYQIIDQTIAIIRILHERMEPENYL